MIDKWNCGIIGKGARPRVVGCYVAGATPPEAERGAEGSLALAELVNRKGMYGAENTTTLKIYRANKHYKK